MHASLMAPAGAMRKALRSLLAVVKAERDRPAFFSLEEGQLVIEVVGTAAMVPVVGTWDARVRVPSGAIPFWADAPLEGEFVHVRVVDGHLEMGGHGVSCEVVDPAEPMVDIRPHPSFSELVALGFAEKARTLENAGLLREVRKARTLLAVCIDLGYTHLTEGEKTFSYGDVMAFSSELRSVPSGHGASRRNGGPRGDAPP